MILLYIDRIKRKRENIFIYGYSYFTIFLIFWITLTISVWNDDIKVLAYLKI